MSDPPAVTAGPRNQDSLPIVAAQFPYDAGLAPVPYTGRNSLKKFLPPAGLELARVQCHGAKA